jgi:hypothetical protein
MLALYLGQHDALSQAIAQIDTAVEAATARMDEAVGTQATFRSLLLCSMQGKDRRLSGMAPVTDQSAWRQKAVRQH